MKPTLLITLISATVLAVAQEPTGGWRRVGDPPPTSGPQTTQQQTASGDPTQPVDRGDGYGQTSQMPQQMPRQMPPAANRPAYGLPAQLTLKPGTYIAVRVNQGLSTGDNHMGDTFSASLMQPVIVDGVVVANRGQIAYGRIAELEKQHSDKPSRLGLELTGITLADGTQAPVRSQLVARQGGSTPGGVQAGTVAATTITGAAVGGAIGYGEGAAAGAGIGAAAGLAGVLLTRHHATNIDPETPLTFDVTAPVVISTVNSAQAFRFVGPEDYDRPYMEQRAPAARPAPRPYAYGYGYEPYYYPYYAYPNYSYWGPSVVIGGGWGRGWGRGGWGRRWR